MASHLPGKQKLMALRLGIVGAYLFRGIALALASWISNNEWVKWFGAAYLVYLMCLHLTQPQEEHHDPKRTKKRPGLPMTIAQIELMDLSLSVDNVVAAVALAPVHDGRKEMWVVYVGVFIGILALRFLAGYCIRLLQKYPILAQAAFILVGYVGFILVFELLTGIHVESWQKFIGVVLIMGVCILYSRNAFVGRVLKPLVDVAFPIMRSFAILLGGFFWPLQKLHEVIARKFRRRIEKAKRELQRTGSADIL
jgi:tellurite resistance protein TerC